MKLILVAKSDLKDNPNHDGTIRLGSDFKMPASASTVSKNISHYIQQIILQKKRIDKKIFPVNFYALMVEDDTFNQLKSLHHQNKNQEEVVEINVPVNRFNLVGYIQVYNNNEYGLCLNNEFREPTMLNELLDLCGILSNDAMEIKKENLGYCPIPINKLTPGLFSKDTDRAVNPKSNKTPDAKTPKR